MKLRNLQNGQSEYIVNWQSDFNVTKIFNALNRTGCILPYQRILPQLPQYCGEWKSFRGKINQIGKILLRRTLAQSTYFPQRARQRPDDEHTAEGKRAGEVFHCADSNRARLADDDEKRRNIIGSRSVTMKGKTLFRHTRRQRQRCRLDWHGFKLNIFYEFSATF